VSQDNRVTPVRSALIPDVDWIERSLSLQPVQLYRLRAIERMYGTTRRMLDRCGCQNESRYPSPSQRSSIWFGLLPASLAPQVVLSSTCSLLDRAWLVLACDGGPFAWAEIWEISGDFGSASGLFDLSFSEPRSLEKWEFIAGNEIFFRVCHGQQNSSSAAVLKLRTAVVKEVIQRNPSFSHVNLSLLFTESEEPEARPFLASGWPENLEVEPLRKRYVPYWQSGDMAYRLFKTYTIVRKDT